MQNFQIEIFKYKEILGGALTLSIVHFISLEELDPESFENDLKFVLDMFGHDTLNLLIKESEEFVDLFSRLVDKHRGQYFTNDHLYAINVMNKLKAYKV